MTFYMICDLSPWLTAWILLTHISIWKKMKTQLETIQYIFHKLIKQFSNLKLVYH